MSARPVGALMRRVTLLQPSRTEDGGGGAQIAFQPVATVWAEIASAAGGEEAELDDLTARVTHTMRIRWRADVRAGWRVEMAPRAFRVRGAVDRSGGRRWLELDCEEEVR
ncbi:MAG: phage head closure protein [Caulobacterales bacterium]|nr:phage head closure protein [Caulobacterales bacterium]